MKRINIFAVSRFISKNETQRKRINNARMKHKQRESTINCLEFGNLSIDERDKRDDKG